MLLTDEGDAPDDLSDDLHGYEAEGDDEPADLPHNDARRRPRGAARPVARTGNRYELRITGLADTIHNYERYLQGERTFEMLSSHSLDDPFFAAILSQTQRGRIGIHL